MGEYATYKGKSVKIGTCENMYYLRYDQRQAVTRESGNVDPVKNAGDLRFRFPWPDEDEIEPGSGKFHDNGYHRGLAIPGFTAPEGVKHHSVQFVAQAGYNVCLPCPESSAYSDHLDGRVLSRGTFDVNDPTYAPLVYRNGFSGSVQLVAQKPKAGLFLVPILRCGGCGAMWREEEISRIEEMAVLLRSEGDRRKLTDQRNGHIDSTTDQFWHQIANRLLAGLMVTV